MATAVVTGASGGIGSAIARRLASDAMTVVVGYNRNAAAAEAVTRDLGAGDHRSLRIPVTDAAELRAAADQTHAWFETIDVLVNCAGKTEPVPHHDLDALSDELIDDIFATNWRGPFAAIRAFLPLLRKPGGTIVNISSVAGVTGQGSNVAYCASKAALDSMTRSLARALGPDLRIVSVAPGWVMGEYAARMPSAVIDGQRESTPLRRLATAADVAAAVSAVIHDLPFTTGAIIPVDGGRPLGVS